MCYFHRNQNTIQAKINSTHKNEKQKKKTKTKQKINRYNINK